MSAVYALHGGTFYSDVDALVSEVAVKRLKSIVSKSMLISRITSLNRCRVMLTRPVSPVFQRNAAELIHIHGDHPFDPLPYLQKTVAEAIAIVIFGNV